MLLYTSFCRRNTLEWLAFHAIGSETVRKSLGCLQRWWLPNAANSSINVKKIVYLFIDPIVEWEDPEVKKHSKVYIFQVGSCFLSLDLSLTSVLVNNINFKKLTKLAIFRRLQSA